MQCFESYENDALRIGLDTPSLCLQTQKQQKLHLPAKQLSFFAQYATFLALISTLILCHFLVPSAPVLLAEMLASRVLLIAAIAVIKTVGWQYFELVTGMLRVVEASLAETRKADFAVKATIV